MRTVFTIIAALSGIICLAFIGMTAVTLGTPKMIGLGEDAEHTFNLRFDGLAIDYEGRLKTFGPNGFQTKTSSTFGITTDHQIRAVDAKHNLTAGEGKLIEIPSLYPIALFGILPALWIVSRLGSKKKGRGFDPEVPAA